MNPLLVAQIIQAALALAEAGSEVYTFLSGVQSRITAAQAAGTDLTDADWSFLDQAASENLTKAQAFTATTPAP